VKAHEKMLQNFLLAVNNGKINELVELLKEDITLYADGGAGQIKNIYVQTNREKLKRFNKN
jgi:hypothetical protein